MRVVPRRESASVYYNLNAGDSTQWLYVPDFSRRDTQIGLWKTEAGE